MPPTTGEPNANGDIYSEDVLREVMMASAQASVELPTDSPEAQAIMEGRHASMSMGASVEPDPDLTDLFMGSREAQDAAQALGWSSGDMALRDDGMHVEFDDAPIEGTTTPNEAARWQVGRQSPPPTSFSRETFSGPSEGQVVSRRGADGRFQAIRPHDPVRRHDPVLDGRPLRQSQGRMVPAPQAQVKQPKAPEPPPPTRYDRLLGPDPY
jgi:hypothetical protein